MRKKCLVLTLVVMICCMCGCQSKEKKDTLEEISVVLDWYPNAVHAFIYEAMEKGYYEEEGLQVKIEFPSSTNDALSLTGAGKADVGIYYQQDMIHARVEQNVPVVSIGSICQKPLNIVLSLKDKNIQSPKDLAGKKIGYCGTILSEAMIQTMMESVGMSMEDCTLVDVGFDLMSAMTTGNVDATIGCMLNHEVPALEKEGFPVSIMELADYGIPNYYELVFVTGEKQLKNEKDKLTRFLRASQKGFSDMKKDPEGALSIMMDNQNAENFPLTESVEKKSFEVLLPVMETEATPFLSQDLTVWEKNMDWMLERGIITKKEPIDDMVKELIQ